MIIPISCLLRVGTICQSGHENNVAMVATKLISRNIEIKNLKAFDTRVRIVYFSFALFGLIEAIRFPLFILLF
jgi:hypothetical protein